MLFPVLWKHKRKQCKIFRKKSKINEVKLRLQIFFLKLYSADYLSSLQKAAENTLLTNDYWINKLQLHAANWLLTVFSLYETHEVIFSRVRAGQVPQNMQLFDLAIFSLSFFVHTVHEHSDKCMWFCAEKCWETAVSFMFLMMFWSAAGGLGHQYR